MPAKSKSSLLHRFAVLTAAATLCLIGIGGLVTSHEAGMAVPDWPTTYGYNMFLFPISQWIGGIFYEHTHRLFASFVGLLTTVLAGWLWFKEPRRWMRWLGGVAFVTVLSQGLLGGLRVVLSKDQIGIFHATFAQLFLLETTAIALFTSRWWRRREAQTGPLLATRGFRSLAIIATIVVFVQLILGATMRHQHAGLAVPDFPLAYGKIFPRMDAAFIQEINQHRLDARDYNPITAFQIAAHMAHRLGALMVLLLVILVWRRARREYGPASALTRGTLGWVGMICLQALLGAATVWSNKAADIATFHVVGGAVGLMTGTLISLAAFRVRTPAGRTVPWENPPREDARFSQPSIATMNCGSSVASPHLALPHLNDDGNAGDARVRASRQVQGKISTV